MNRDDQIRIRLSAEEKAEIAERATATGTTISEYMRSKALGFSPPDPSRAVPASQVKGILSIPVKQEPVDEDGFEALVTQLYGQGMTRSRARREARRRVGLDALAPPDDG